MLLLALSKFNHFAVTDYGVYVYVRWVRILSACFNSFLFPLAFFTSVSAFNSIATIQCTLSITSQQCVWMCVYIYIFRFVYLISPFCAIIHSSTLKPYFIFQCKLCETEVKSIRTQHFKIKMCHRTSQINKLSVCEGMRGRKLRNL